MPYLAVTVNPSTIVIDSIDPCCRIPGSCSTVAASSYLRLVGVRRKTAPYGRYGSYEWYDLKMSAEPLPAEDGERELSASAARAHFPELVKLAEYRGEVTYVAHRGKGRVAAIVPLDVVEAAERWEDLQLGAMAEESIKASDGQPNVPLEELMGELDQ